MFQNTTGSISANVPSYEQIIWWKINLADMLKIISTHLKPVKSLLKQNKNRIHDNKLN